MRRLLLLRGRVAAHHLLLRLLLLLLLPLPLRLRLLLMLLVGLSELRGGLSELIGAIRGLLLLLLLLLLLEVRLLAPVRVGRRLLRLLLLRKRVVVRAVAEGVPRFRGGRRREGGGHAGEGVGAERRLRGRRREARAFELLAEARLCDDAGRSLWKERVSRVSQVSALFGHCISTAHTHSSAVSHAAFPRRTLYDNVHPRAAASYTASPTHSRKKPFGIVPNIRSKRRRTRRSAISA